MKDSGIEWIGEIPQGWETRRLRFICNIKTGDKDTINREIDGEYPFYVRSPIIERISTYSFEGEAVLMAGDGVGAGKVFHYANCKFDYHQRVYNLHNFRRVSGKYLYYYLIENFWKEIESYNAKSTVDSVRLPMLRNFPVVIGSVKEQISIADYLDNKTVQIESIIEKQQILIEKLKTYKQSIITEAVTKGLDPSVPMKDSGIKWIGEIPQGWELFRLKNLIIFNPKMEYELPDDSEVSFLPMECVGQNKLDTSKSAKVIDLNGSYTYFADGDLIMAKVTPCFENGNIALACNLLNGIGFGSSELYVFRCINIYRKYLLYFLQNSIFKQWATSTMHGTGGLKRVASDFILNYKLAVPSPKEQHLIAKYLDKKCNEIDKSIEQKQKLIDSLKDYKKSLIFEAVTGKIEVKVNV
jgi:type I restriction enzyme S subunit